jgi:hypothetical protein
VAIAVPVQPFDLLQGAQQARTLVGVVMGSPHDLSKTAR